MIRTMPFILPLDGLNANLFCIAALVLAAIAIYVFRPRKKVIVLQCRQKLSQEAMRRLQAYAGQSLVSSGAIAIVLDESIEAAHQGPIYNIHIAGGVDDKDLDRKIAHGVLNAIQASRCQRG